jgi:DNA-binding LacI/PurR family transcriptional regulator
VRKNVCAETRVKVERILRLRGYLPDLLARTVEAARKLAELAAGWAA